MGELVEGLLSVGVSGGGGIGGQTLFDRRVRLRTVIVWSCAVTSLRDFGRLVAGKVSELKLQCCDAGGGLTIFQPTGPAAKDPLLL